MQDDSQQHEDEFDEEYTTVSKSQLKRDMQAIVDMAEKLLTLPEDKIARTGISVKALGALHEARPMKASGAKKRQLKYIAKLLKNEDMTVLQTLVEETDARHQAANKKFHQLEKWRDRLIEEGDSAIEALSAVMPEIDRQHIRQLIRQAQKELLQEKPPAAARKLFKYLRETSGY